MFGVLTKYHCSNHFRLRSTSLRFYNRFKPNNEARKYIGRTGSPNKLTEIDLEGEEFRVLVLPGFTDLKGIVGSQNRQDSKFDLVVPGKRKVELNDDWTKVWPTASSFKWSVVPLPVRMGRAKGQENDGVPPAKNQNTELMKIPNFLHLTPPHIKNHCRALNEFCTKWPEELDTDEKIDSHFPVEIMSHEYIRDAPTHRDIRARVVTLQIKLSSLELDDHARDKILRLLKDKYDPETDMIILRGDRCPLRKQNYDYVHYLLTVLYHESKKTEKWESEIAVEDMSYYDWNLHNSKDSLIKILTKIKEVQHGDTMTKDEEKLKEKILENDIVQEIKSATENIYNDGENVESLNKYKDNLKQLLIQGIS